MELLGIIFRLGVVLAIFAFIWALIRFGFTLLRGGLPLPYPATLSLKAIQYAILADVCLLFCIEKENTDLVHVVLTGAILLMYFVGKIQNQRLKVLFIQVQGFKTTPQQQPNMRLEIGIVALAMLAFVVLYFNQALVKNDISMWFYKTILDIEKAPIFGFIFKIVGFFFTVTIIMRMAQSFTVLLGGGQNNRPNTPNQQRNENDFDDYEEIK